MKRFLLLLLPIMSALQAFAYDLSDFVNSCKEMPNANYRVMEGKELQEMLKSVAALPSVQKAQGNKVSPDSLFSDVKKVETVIFMDLSFLDNMSNPNANEVSNNNVFAEVKDAASKIDGYDEYVYGSLIPAGTVDQQEYDELTAQLNDEQKAQLNELLNKSFKLAIFGKRTTEAEFQNPVVILSIMGITNIMVMDGIVPIVNIDSWINSIQI